MSGPDPQSDRKLVEAANRGDMHAFETLYLRHREYVVRLAYRFTGKREDALDVLQETFIYLLKKIPGLRLTAAMTSFLYPVVKHISFNIKRRKMKSMPDEGFWIAPSAAENHDAQRDELALVMRELPQGQQEVLLMRFVDDMSLKEIAQALDIPPGTVKSRLHNGLDKLRRDPKTRDYFLD